MDANLNLSIIVAVSENGIIGVDGELPPWNLKADLKRFVQLTKGHMVIVGRKTHESILKRLGHPLKDRTTVILTRQENFLSPNQSCIVLCSPDNAWNDALSLARNQKDEVFVIGGAKIYELALPYTNTIYLTRVHASFEGNILFPTINPDEWEEVSWEHYPADEKNSHPYSFLIWKRKGEPRQFVNLEHARLGEQRRIMENILSQGICPFCVEHLWKFHKKPILKQTRHWILTENQWPYENTRVHLLAVYTLHVESLGEMEPEAGKELVELIQWAEHKYKLSSGTLALGMRFGNPEASGATVRHLHAQLLSTAITDKNDCRYKPVRFRAG